MLKLYSDLPVKQLFYDNKLSATWLFIFGLLISCPALILAFFGINPLYFLVGIIGVLYLFLCVKYPKFWILSVFLSFVLFFRTTEEGIDAFDIAHGGFLIVGLSIWLGFRLASKNFQLIKNKSEWLLLAFFLLLILNIAVAKFNYANLGNWAREYLLFALTLYYFPFREYLSNKKSFQQFLFIGGLLIIGLGASQFYLYSQRLSIAEYAYQLGFSVRTNQVAFTMGSIISMIYFFYIKNIWSKIYTFLVITISIASLITTFSRTFWIILILCYALQILLLPIRKKIQFALIAAVASSIIIGAVLITVNDIAQIFFKYIEKRFTSTAKGKKDVSVEARFVEYENALKYIKRYPLGGNGLGKKFSYYNSLSMNNWHAHIVHNGYLHLAYRIGIPLTLLYLLVFFVLFYKCIIAFLCSKNEFSKMLSIMAMNAFILHILANMTSPQFMFRDGIIMIAVTYYFTYFAEKESLKSEIISK